MIDYLTNIAAAVCLALLSCAPVIVAFYVSARCSRSRFDVCYDPHDYEPDYHPRGCTARRRR